ncbi:hypothetical protein [Rhodococcus opacus]|uniref:hypothetical protein n=1 Tax=Rhodococcus opacus TaxID=37919 RepID=UPI0015FAB2E9|nr:hypothetical protein [Rhodococcus opacus]
MTRRRGSNKGSLVDRLPARFLRPVIDPEDVFGSLNAYMDDLDLWVREELRLPDRRDWDSHHNKTDDLREEIGIDIAEWIRIGMTS